jgi:hypothetical protein
MFGRIVSITISLGLLGSQAFSQQISQPPLSVKGMTPWAQRIYLDGVVDGFQIVNAKLQRQGQKPLFCIPEKVVLFGRDLLVFSSKDLSGPQDDITVAVSGLLGLMERYPCPGSQRTQASSESESNAVTATENEP